MGTQSVVCPLNRRQLVDEYFIENRTKILDVAAFLDRLDRAGSETTPPDFRVEALQNALSVLNSSTESRVMQIQMIFSDPTTEPRPKLDQKGAKGAFDSRTAEVG
jgi:hypothetical protein